MGITPRMKAELIIYSVLFVEFFVVSIKTFLTQQYGIFSVSGGICFGLFIWIFFKLVEIYYPYKGFEDEYIAMIVEKGYFIGSITGLLMLAQLAVLEVLTGITMSIMSAFIIVSLTSLIVGLVSGAIPINLDSGDENKE